MDAKRRILIADSGSTKTDWIMNGCLMKTSGMNPVMQNDETILSILGKELVPQLKDRPEEVIFYGSGVREDQEVRMERLLGKALRTSGRIEAHSDMLGAARALCGDMEGIACILGTGANSCLYDGRHIVKNTPAMGYVLGDEGSGAVLGKLFLNALYKGRLYRHAQEDFERNFGMSLPKVIDNVYRQPMPNRWLASLSPYIHGLLSEPSVREIVVENFRAFFRHNIAPYGHPELPVSAVGSVAYYYRDQLEEAAVLEGCTLSRVLRSPLDDLVQME